MKELKLIGFIIGFFGVSLVAQSQTVTDTIVIEPSFFKSHFYQNGNPLKTNQMLMMIQDDDEAYDLMNSSQEARIFGSIFGVLGVALFIIPMGTSLTGRETSWALAWAGGGLATISVPLFLKAKRQSIDAINYYNFGILHPVQPPSGLGFYLENTKNGIGLVIRF